LKEFHLPGLIFRPLHFLPTFQKHAGRLCGGAQIHITDRDRFMPFKTATAILKAVHELYPRKFRWNNAPYEYEKKLLPIDILAGTERFRREIELGADIDAMETWWDQELSGFDKNTRRKYLIYS